MSKKIFAALVILTIACTVSGTAVFAQQAPPPSSTQASPHTVTDQDIALLREDIRSQKKQLIAANMQLTDTEATKFWPVYDQYTAAASKIGDSRLALIKEYAQTYDAMTDAQAKSLIQRWADTDQASMNLRMQYIPKFEAVLPGKKAALFFQIDRRLSLLMDLQLASMIPMVKQ